MPARAARRCRAGRRAPDPRTGRASRPSGGWPRTPPTSYGDLRPRIRAGTRLRRLPPRSPASTASAHPAGRAVSAWRKRRTLPEARAAVAARRVPRGPSPPARSTSTPGPARAQRAPDGTGGLAAQGDDHADHGGRVRSHERWRSASCSWAVAPRGWGATRRCCPTGAARWRSGRRRSWPSSAAARRSSGRRRGAFNGGPFPFVEDGAAPAAAAFGVVAAPLVEPRGDEPRPRRRPPALPVGVPVGASRGGGRDSGPGDRAGLGRPPAAALRRLAEERARPADGAPRGRRLLSPRDALTALGAVLIPEEETACLPGGAPSSFFNVNTPEDYEALESEAADAPRP